MLLYELSSLKGRLLLSVLMLEEAGRNRYAVAGVDQVVSHESRHFADDGWEALPGHLRYLLRVGYALVAAHRNVHSFTSFLTRLRDSKAGSDPFHHKQGATSRRPVQTSENLKQAQFAELASG